MSYDEADEARDKLALKRYLATRKTKRYKLACSMNAGITRLSAPGPRPTGSSYDADKKAALDRVVNRGLRLLERERVAEIVKRTRREEEAKERQLRAKIKRR